MSYRLRMILLRLNHIVVCAPDFPPEEETTTEREVDALVEELDELARTDSKKFDAELLNLVRIEIADAAVRARAGDIDACRVLLTSAEAHLNEATSKKPRAVAFVAGPDGIRKAGEPHDG
ncbi:MAG: hypothetical protein L6R30_02475 [Thermoanaerobaculia bacterium]|nr:hypothetical protein [Thermoanaerobaculia bacterium]